MTCEVRNKEINSQCTELLVRPLYFKISICKVEVMNIFYLVILKLRRSYH